MLRQPLRAKRLRATSRRGFTEVDEIYGIELRDGKVLIT